MKPVSVIPPERLNLREFRLDRVPVIDALVPWEDRRLFAQLLNDGSHDAGQWPSLAGIKVSGDISLVDALNERLVSRIEGASQWPLTAVLYLPHLGRIDSRIGQEQGAWTIELQAERESTTRWLSGVRQQSEQRLAESLARPVSLRLTHTAPA